MVFFVDKRHSFYIGQVKFFIERGADTWACGASRAVRDDFVVPLGGLAVDGMAFVVVEPD